MFWFANDTPALGHAGLRALNSAERAGPSPELARAYAMLCLAAGSIPIHPLARIYSRRALEIARIADPIGSLAYVRFTTSVYRIGTARWDEAQEALDEAEAIFERLGDLRLLGDTRTAQGMLGIYRGHFETAGALFTKLYDHAVRYESLQHQVWASLGKAASELRCGRPAEAAHVLERVLELLVEHPDPAEQIQAYGLLAGARWRQGEDAAGPRRRILGREPHDPQQAANRLLPVRGLHRGRRGPPRPDGGRRPLTRDQAGSTPGLCGAAHLRAYLPHRQAP